MAAMWSQSDARSARRHRPVPPCRGMGELARGWERANEGPPNVARPFQAADFPALMTMPWTRYWAGNPAASVWLKPGPRSDPFRSKNSA